MSFHASEEHIAKLDNDRHFIDLFWSGVLIVAQKGTGCNLAKVQLQAGEHFDALRERDCRCIQGAISRPSSFTIWTIGRPSPFSCARSRACRGVRLHLRRPGPEILLETSPHTVHGDTLEMDVAGLAPPDVYCFVFGNPLLGGAKFQRKDQRAQVRRIADLSAMVAR